MFFWSWALTHIEVLNSQFVLIFPAFFSPHNIIITANSLRTFKLC